MAIETFVKQQQLNQSLQKSSNKKSTTIQVDSLNNMNSKILLNVPTIIDTNNQQPQEANENNVNEKMFSIKSVDMSDSYLGPALVLQNNALSTIKSESSKISVSSLKKKNK